MVIQNNRDPTTFLGSVWGIICYNLEVEVPSQAVFGSIGKIIEVHIKHGIPSGNIR